MICRPHPILGACLLSGLLLTSSCTSVMTHGGVSYKIAPDKRPHHIEKGADGRMMYDSPELTVISENGNLTINGQPAGAVNPGDKVEITDLGTVLVNGQRRGDTMMGHQQITERIEHVVR